MISTVDSLLEQGKITAARLVLADMTYITQDAAALQLIGERFTRIGSFQAAYGAYKKAVTAAPKESAALYNLATAALSLGEMTEAETLLDKVIALTPTDYDAYYNRATLRKWTPENNHIDAMEHLLKAGIPDRKGAVQLFFALAKEYEDIGDYAPAFAHLQRGANLRGAMMTYRVETDTRAMAQIKAAYDTDFSAHILPVQNGPGPIFVVGLPRTGTTLVDRILSSHSQIQSLGEITDLANAVIQLSSGASDKGDMISRSPMLDFEALATLYRKTTEERGGKGIYLIDKTPSNFLYIGLIVRALPEARIIHLKRGPMDSCFAIYKTLFRMGYPYSYSLDNLAQYYAAYEGLMAHWHALLPGRILDVAYEDIVTDIEAETRKMLAYIGLPWEAACLEFHKNKSPSATASAAQVRRPVYASSVGLWKNYARELTPLQKALIAAGIPAEKVAA